MAIDGQKRLVLFQYDGSTAQLYRFVAGQAAFLDASASTALVNAFTPSNNWRLGGRADGNVDRFFEEHIKRVFFGGRVLTTVEMEAIAAETQTPSGVLGANAVRNWLFTTAAATVLDEVGGHAATRQGANWPAAVEW